jgi:cystathionine beta-lyase/cystathionine gamma-synthase
LGGVTVGEPELIKKIFIFLTYGPSLSPFNAWFIKSLETLAIRLEQAL